jgi:hypothetical protein
VLLSPCNLDLESGSSLGSLAATAAAADKRDLWGVSGVCNCRGGGGGK